MRGGHRLAAALLAAAVACARGPDAGGLGSVRAADEDDLAVAERAVAQYRRRVRQSDDPATTGRVARVGRAILAAAKAGPAGEPAGRLAWQLVVVESPNATVATFANGTVFVDAGLVRTLPTDDALAAALGHAVARVLLWSGGESSARRTARSLIGLGVRPASRPLAESERERTAEADYAGLVLAVEAGYDPERALAMFDRLGLRERGDHARKRAAHLRPNGTAHP